MSKHNDKKLSEVLTLFPAAREGFKNDVARASYRATQMARTIAASIGEISVLEAKMLIVVEFCDELGVETRTEEKK